MSSLVSSNKYIDNKISFCTLSYCRFVLAKLRFFGWKPLSQYMYYDLLDQVFLTYAVFIETVQKISPLPLHLYDLTVVKQVILIRQKTSAVPALSGWPNPDQHDLQWHKVRLWRSTSRHPLAFICRDPGVLSLPISKWRGYFYRVSSTAK